MPKHHNEPAKRLLADLVTDAATPQRAGFEFDCVEINDADMGQFLNARAEEKDWRDLIARPPPMLSEEHLDRMQADCDKAVADYRAAKAAAACDCNHGRLDCSCDKLIEEFPPMNRRTLAVAAVAVAAACFVSKFVPWGWAS